MKRSIVLSVLLVAGVALAQGKQKSAREEIARLEKELADQRALLVKILELQVERDQQLLRMVQTGQVTSLTPLPTPTPVAPVATEPPPTPPPAVEVKATSSNVPKTKGPTATVTGTLKVKNAQGPAFVFVEDVRGPMATGSLEIKQEDKQFSPRVAVVPLGTKVDFPNLDSIFHNVFSVSVGNEFDLGTARKGDAVKSHVMTKPGVVEIFCNMHSRMSATVLVTPSSLYARAGADGSFKLDNVPVGSHRISAWAGGATVSTQTVDVTASGAKVDLELDTQSQAAHKNKLGQPYGSYGD